MTTALNRKTILRRICVFAAIASWLLFSRAAFAQGGILQALPEEGAAVKAGDIISYTIRIDSGSETSNKTFLRVELGEGMLLLEDSMQINCIQFTPAPAAPEADDDAIEAVSSGIPYTFVPGNNGFVLICPALRAGDSFSFDAKINEDADPAIVVEGESIHAALTHVYQAESTPAVISSVKYEAPLPDKPAEDANWIWISAIALFAIACAIFLVYRKQRSKKQNASASKSNTRMS